MTYERLIKTGRIRPYSAKPSEIKRLIQVAHRDINTARAILDKDSDWAYSIAYNSLLQASRALMLSEGYRPRGGEQHATVVEFIEESLGQAYEKQVQLFDQMRRKRHRVIYEITGLISTSEAEQAITFATNFIEKITEIITGQSRLDI